MPRFQFSLARLLVAMGYFAVAVPMCRVLPVFIFIPTFVAGLVGIGLGVRQGEGRLFVFWAIFLLALILALYALVRVPLPLS